MVFYITISEHSANIKKIIISPHCLIIFHDYIVGKIIFFLLYESVVDL